MDFEFWQLVAAVIIGNTITLVSAYAIIRIERHERTYGSDEGIPAWPYFLAAAAPGMVAVIAYLS